MSYRLDTLLPPEVRAARVRAQNAANGVLPYLHAIMRLERNACAAWDEVDDALREMNDALRSWDDSLAGTLRLPSQDIALPLDGDGRDGHNGTGPFEGE